MGEYPYTRKGTRRKMISVKCIKCKKELDKQGGLLFSPPNKEDYDSVLVEKNHLCVDCYWLVKKELEEK